ncbi:MAG: tetratricopeptide repeat protein [Candidatus Margulisbacteria bacterium]|nr:tetratricopeptide repeat protein [Candidatus Margulisiibacteriota bacterium]
MIKKTLFSAIVFLFSYSLAMNTESTNTFQKANDFYKNEQYIEALMLYKKLVNEGVYSVGLYFNMGNAYFKLKDFINSRYYYEKAYLYSPNDKSIAHNLALVKVNFQDREDKKADFIQNSYSLLKNSLSLDSIIWCYLILLTLFLLSLLFYRHSRKKIINVRRLSYMLFGLLLLFFLLTYSRVSYFFSPDQALVYIDRVEVKSGPSDDLATLFIIHQGAKVRVIQKNDSWINIEYTRQLNGWIPAKSIKVI